MWAWLKFSLETFLKRSNFSGNFEQLVDRASTNYIVQPGPLLIVLYLDLTAKSLDTPEIQLYLTINSNFKKEGI